MFIIPEKRALVFKLREPSRILTVIPTAKTVLDKHGYPLVAVPFKPDETRVCRNLGFKVPDPMPILYHWPGKFAPYKEQITTASFLVMQDRCFCLNSFGLGKTISSLWAYDYLKGVGQAKKVLVVCPLSTMEETWAKTVFHNFPHLEAVVLHGTRDRRLRLLKQDADVYIINTDGLETIGKALEKRSDIDLIIVDEMALYRNSSTNRWKALNVVCNKQSRRRIWALTGAPTPNEPTDAWAQCRIMYPDSERIPKYYTKFREMVMRQVTQFKWVPKDNALDVVFEMMQPAIRFSLDDCVDLPEQTFVTHQVELTDEQKAAYKAMLDKLKAEYAGGEILAVNEAVKASKLTQICLGVAYGTNGERITLPCEPRIAALKELIDAAEGKVIVFVPLTGALESVAAELSQDYTVATVHGGTSKAQRDEAFGNFQETKDPRILVANPGTMSHGLTLTAASLIVWYGATNSCDTYMQANARMRRPGQTRTTVIAHLVSSEIERRIFERLKNKEKMQSVLLQMLKDNPEGEQQ